MINTKCTIVCTGTGKDFQASPLNTWLSRLVKRFISFQKQHQRKPRECKSAENAQGYKKPGKKGESLLAKVESTHKAQASLNLYKGLKIIQSTLKTDDVSWDY